MSGYFKWKIVDCTLRLAISKIDVGQHVILCSQPIDIDLRLIKNVKSPVNKFDAVNKAYADRIKYETATV